MADKFNPATFAGDMQQRARKEMKFDEFEASLPDPKSKSFKMPGVPPSSLSLGGLVKMLGQMNPLGKNVSRDDTVWLLDNTAFRTSRLRSWQAEYVAAVFERDPGCKVADIVSGIAQTVGLADDARERDVIEERILPFLWDIRMVRTVRVATQGKEIKMTPTNVNGISTQVLKVPGADKGSLVKSSAKVPPGANGILEARTFYAGVEGWGIITGQFWTKNASADRVKSVLTGLQMWTIPSRSP